MLWFFLVGSEVSARIAGPGSPVAAVAPVEINAQAPAQQGQAAEAWRAEYDRILANMKTENQAAKWPKWLQSYQTHNSDSLSAPLGTNDADYNQWVKPQSNWQVNDKSAGFNYNLWSDPAQQSPVAAAFAKKMNAKPKDSTIDENSFATPHRRHRTTTTEAPAEPAHIVHHRTPRKPHVQGPPDDAVVPFDVTPPPGYDTPAPGPPNNAVVPQAGPAPAAPAVPAPAAPNTPAPGPPNNAVVPVAGPPNNAVVPVAGPPNNAVVPVAGPPAAAAPAPAAPVQGPPNNAVVPFDVTPPPGYDTAAAGPPNDAIVPIDSPDEEGAPKPRHTPVRHRKPSAGSNNLESIRHRKSDGSNNMDYTTQRKSDGSNNMDYSKWTNNQNGGYDYTQWMNGGKGGFDYSKYMGGNKQGGAGAPTYDYAAFQQKYAANQHTANTALDQEHAQYLDAAYWQKNGQQWHQANKNQVSDNYGMSGLFHAQSQGGMASINAMAFGKWSDYMRQAHQEIPADHTPEAFFTWQKANSYAGSQVDTVTPTWQGVQAYTKWLRAQNAAEYQHKPLVDPNERSTTAAMAWGMFSLIGYVLVSVALAVAMVVGYSAIKIFHKRRQYETLDKLLIPA